jgi:pyrroline-5-carboxylate reductase
LLRGWTAAGVAPIAVIDPNVDAVPGARKLAGADALADLGGPLCLVLAVKPAMIAQTLTQVSKYLDHQALVISVAAGVSLATLRRCSGAGPAVVRTMPNTPAAIGKGAVTAVSGSGPAYFYRFTELLAQTGLQLGLPLEMADRLATLTFTGAAALLEATGKPAAQLRVEVTSPNGVTAAALAAFDRQDRLGALITEAGHAAVKRNREMGA